MTTTTATEPEWQARDATPTEALNAWTERAAKLEAENAKLRRERREPQPVTLDDAYAAIRETVEENKRLRAEVKELRRGPAGTIAEAIAMLGAEARDSEGVIDTVRRLIESQARPASPRMLAAIQGQAREGELPDQTVERLIRERDGLRKNFAGAIADLRETEREREQLRTRNEQLRADVETLAHKLEAAEGDLASTEHADRGAPVWLERALPAIRAGINALGSSEEDVRQRNAARDAVRALEAAAEGAEPAAVLSAAELEAVRGVLDAAAAINAAGDDADLLHEAHGYWAQAWAAYEAAGRPLASEGKEG